MKQIDCIWIVSPIGYAHSHVFDVVAESFSKSLQELGHKAEIVRAGLDCKVYLAPIERPVKLVFGANLLTYSALNTCDIIYQAEQIGTSAITPKYLSLLKDHEVWDYSKVNIERLEKDHGIKAKYVPVGYHPCMTNPLIPKLKQDIDVLFYGSRNHRRLAILDQLESKGLNVVSLFGVYGDKLDEYIARSKIVLNVHYYDTAIFEIFRCAYLFANKRFVVSERGADEALDRQFFSCANFYDYRHITDACVVLCDKINKESQERIVFVSETAFKTFSNSSQKTILEGVLNAK